MSRCPFLHGQNQITTDIASPGTHNGEMQYGDYLALDKILGGQKPLSESPDEMLFIIQHQTSELWMKLLIHELTRAAQSIACSQLPFAMRVMDRAQRILEHLVDAWDVLGTLSPAEFLKMRSSLGSASGHQSTQFREIEFMLGNKRMQFLHGQLEGNENLREKLFSPSLYEEVVRELARQGLPVSQDRVQIDVSSPTEQDETVEQSWLIVYHNIHDYFQLYSLAEKLVAFEDSFRLWRFRHISMVEKVIGAKTGTAGSSGARYLNKTLDTILFPELWQLRTKL